jgi:hypothetical protein
MEKDLKIILDASFGYCKCSDDTVANFFRKINDEAHKALKHVERHPKLKNHWTQKHYKNYHMN